MKVRSPISFANGIGQSAKRGVTPPPLKLAMERRLHIPSSNAAMAERNLARKQMQSTSLQVEFSQATIEKVGQFRKTEQTRGQPVQNLAI